MKKLFIQRMEASKLMDKKEKIFNAGRELFYSKGFKDTNVSDITRLAGVGVGTFYNYYSSRILRKWNSRDISRELEKYYREERQKEVEFI